MMKTETKGQDRACRRLREQIQTGPTKKFVALMNKDPKLAEIYERELDKIAPCSKSDIEERGGAKARMDSCKVYIRACDEYGLKDLAAEFRKELNEIEYIYKHWEHL